MALTTSGSINDDKASAIYGDPASATRMPRIESIAAEASEATSSTSGESAIGDAFIDGSTVKGFSPTQPVRDGGAVTPGTPGFPGIGGDVTYEDGPTPGQGKVVKSSKAPTVGASSVSNNPAVSGAPGFPGLP